MFTEKSRRRILGAFAVIVIIVCTAVFSLAEVLMPEASGQKVLKDNKIVVDASHADQGYVMVKAPKTSTKMKVLVKTSGAELKYDINGDGETDNKDVVILFRYLSGSTVDVNVIALDINGDGSVDNKDVVVLFRYLSGDTSVEISNIPYVPAGEEAPAAIARRVPNLYSIK